VGGRATYHFNVWDTLPVSLPATGINTYYNPNNITKLKVTIKGPLVGIGTDFNVKRSLSGSREKPNE
jgi:hypothetical protein